MSFKRRVFRIIIAGFAAMVVLFILLSQFAFRWVSDSIARQEAGHTFQHAVDLLNNDLDHLAITVADWSLWDDSYAYLQERSPDYESVNLQEESFLTLQLSSFSIADRQGRDRFLFPPAQTVLSENLEALRIAALRSGTAKGILEFDGKFHFAAVGAVLRSDGSGPAAGTIAMTRTIDQKTLDKIMSILDSDVSVERAPETIRAAGATATRLPDGKYESFGEIYIGEAATAAALRVRLEKRAISLPIPIFMLIMLAVLAVLLTVSSLILITLDRTVIRQIDRMGKEVEAAEGKRSFRVTVEAEDELGRFGGTLNRAFDALERTLEERDSLLQEIRHRVKNNLQVVASLLNLQADESENPETAAILQNSRRRVLAMAFVHEELYCADTLNSINLREYLERLSILIRHSLDPSGTIRFEYAVPDLDLSIERAVPFALIANEVLTNAYQHAFREEDRRGGKAETVALSLREEPEGRYAFTLRDNGSGIAQPAEGKRTLGLTLIQALSLQLGASYRYEPATEGGTLFLMHFNRA